ncbi:MAG: pantoate--beta-alanine ligase [Nitrospinae bacterium]|nr:pantoate--beta-alanine ligase [Nitrospinota bacterium]
MRTIQTVKEMKAWSAQARRPLGLVPTMGCLHEGHMSLVRKCRSACRSSAVSVFVNPAQFGPSEDLNGYPRTLESDRKKLEDAGVDVLFLPGPGEIYPPGYKTYVNVEDITSRLCGKSRPQFFRGVATVVLKLFNIARPDLAFFGEKDWQQLETLRTMARDLDLDVTIESLPIVREADGLAMSSRNVYLSPEQRESALSLSRSLSAAREMFRQGERSAEKIRARIREIVEKQSARIDYVSVCDPRTFVEQEKIGEKALVALAVWVGTTRLIDNCLIERT